MALSLNLLLLFQLNCTLEVRAPHPLAFFHCHDDSKSPLLHQEGHRTLGATSGATTALDHASHTEASEAAMMMTLANAGAGSH
jgi:hypothetical protein